MKMNYENGKRITPPLMFREYTVVVEVWSYQNGRLALLLVDPHDGERVANASVNLPDAECKADECYIKDWSENAGIERWLINNEVIDQEPVGEVSSGHITARRYKLSARSVANLIT